MRAGRTWHIGNIENFEKDKGYFAFGRTTRTTNTKFDEDTGNFVEEDFETSPYTHVVFNTAIGFLGIAHNHRLARRPTGIASKLQQVLRRTAIVMDTDVEVLISPISDPEGFLRTIARAYRVLRFTAHFTGPNPFDADEFFQKPLSVYAAKANAAKGKAQIDGEDLDKSVVSEVARSTAATGNKASARVKRTRNQAPETVGLRGEPIKRRFDEMTHDPENVVDELTSAYDKVRQDG
ncbi:hypothetical protein [Bremerella volcania]|uniref:hypothetical protein n=1 Tax=Bremerella volcania TaxID=2527984 RepID=UPI0011A56571|nr:hypothetical protein [Bremerella volcania]